MVRHVKARTGVARFTLIVTCAATVGLLMGSYFTPVLLHSLWGIGFSPVRPTGFSETLAVEDLKISYQVDVSEIDENDEVVLWDKQAEEFLAYDVASVEKLFGGVRFVVLDSRQDHDEYSSFELQRSEYLSVTLLTLPVWGSVASWMYSPQFQVLVIFVLSLTLILWVMNSFPEPSTRTRENGS